ncbi:hypothetical protein [Rhizohabitans arisaemae]|uniref:hypothetical protein n=1 Tax=Rhizohabitans arisaemae TaxID=2720610 RepID=UPI0024B11EA1|nr:hypothetical protein [Rhizohabitans arisaemae]
MRRPIAALACAAALIAPVLIAAPVHATPSDVWYQECTDGGGSAHLVNFVDGTWKRHCVGGRYDGQHLRPQPAKPWQG